MKSAAFILAALLIAAPAHAQIGGILNKAQKAKETKDKADNLHFTDQEERDLGEKISTMLCQNFGVYQDKDVTKYVSLVGGVLAQQSKKPSLNWTFIILDTEAVNAFAAPGGIVHVTKGLLGLVKNEAELAGVLGHEITHVTERHTISAITKGTETSLVTDAAGAAGGARVEFIAKLSEKGFNYVADGAYSQADENESDKIGIQLANKLGYAATGLVDVLKKIDARNAKTDDRNGLFANHPSTNDRIKKLEEQIKKEKLNAAATVQARYAGVIKFDAMPLTEIAVTNVAGASGLAGGDGKSADKKDDKDNKDNKEEPKKKSGNPLSKIGLSGGQQAQNTQTAASAGARGVGGADRNAVGGPNKNKLTIPVTPAELEAFKKGIVA
jgi:predicted Zn-dependent protease